jgi:hypothetical protein
MLPLHHDPGRRNWLRCRGIRLIQTIAPYLLCREPLPSSNEQPVWESNPPLRLERAVSWADRRTSRSRGVGRGALESPSAGLQPAARPSQLPARSEVQEMSKAVATPRTVLHPYRRDIAAGCSRDSGRFELIRSRYFRDARCVPSDWRLRIDLPRFQGSVAIRLQGLSP